MTDEAPAPPRPAQPAGQRPPQPHVPLPARRERNYAKPNRAVIALAHIKEPKT